MLKMANGRTRPTPARQDALFRKRARTFVSHCSHLASERRFTSLERRENKAGGLFQHPFRRERRRTQLGCWEEGSEGRLP